MAIQDVAPTQILRQAKGSMSRKTDPFAVELTPELIVRAYQAGIFPMAEDASADDVFWVSPDSRGIIPLEVHAYFQLPSGNRRIMCSRTRSSISSGVGSRIA